MYYLVVLVGNANKLSLADFDSVVGCIMTEDASLTKVRAIGEVIQKDLAIA
jgi:hypothetical protein